MDAMALRAAKDTLSAVVDRVARTHERVVITRNGQPAAVLISPVDLDALEETLDVLSDEETLRRVREGRAELARGEVLEPHEVDTLLAKVRR